MSSVLRFKTEIIWNFAEEHLRDLDPVSAVRTGQKRLEFTPPFVIRDLLVDSLRRFRQYPMGHIPEGVRIRKKNMIKTHTGV